MTNTNIVRRTWFALSCSYSDSSPIFSSTAGGGGSFGDSEGKSKSRATAGSIDRNQLKAVKQVSCVSEEGTNFTLYLRFLNCLSRNLSSTQLINT